jgi:predicted dehydrogenase
MLDAHPVKAVGRGGRQGRNRPGDTCYSHFDVVFEYPKDVHVSFSSTQFGKGQFDVNEQFYGTRGSSQSPYAGPLGIWGEEQWVWGGGEKPAAPSGQFSASGSFSDNLAEADSEKQKAFIHSITSGQFHNQAAAGVESAMSAMLGRQAAYAGRELTWDELQRSNEHWDAGIDLNKLA